MHVHGVLKMQIQSFCFTAAVWFSGTETVACKRVLQIALTRCDLSRVAESKRSASKSPVKRAGPSTGARQSAGGTGGRSAAQSGGGVVSGVATGNRTGQAPYNRARAAATKERECPLAASCDSRGHLSGKLDSHFTLEACPLYHNTTPQACA